MGWMTRTGHTNIEDVDIEDSSTKPSDPVAPFPVNITPGQYYRLPWTIEQQPVIASSLHEWTCLELDVHDTSPTAFDRKCREAADHQLTLATQGLPPKLPVGMVWRDGYPTRNPRYSNLNR